jgi:hypothetical protein
MGFPPQVMKCPGWSHKNSRGVGRYFRQGYEPQLLDMRKYDSVSTALTALNAGMVNCRSFCLVFSQRKSTYYILWPFWKTQKEVDDFTEQYRSSPVSKDENVNLSGVQGRDRCDSSSFSEVSTTVSKPGNTTLTPTMSSESLTTCASAPCLTPQKPWVHTNILGVGAFLRAGYESQLLDTRKYDSVSKALTALNAGEVDCQSFCLVFSQRKSTYYILWPFWKTKKEVDDFSEQYRSSPVSKDENVNNRNGVQGRDRCDSSSFAEVCTTVSKPGNTTLLHMTPTMRSGSMTTCASAPCLRTLPFRFYSR